MALETCRYQHKMMKDLDGNRICSKCLMTAEEIRKKVLESFTTGSVV